MPTSPFNWSDYRFDSTKQTLCAICGGPLNPKGEKWPDRWCDPGVGKLCRSCDRKKSYDEKGFPYDNYGDPDLVKLGLVRNIVKIDARHTEEGGKRVYSTGNGEYDFTFEALIDGEWWFCSSPCGNWSFVAGYHFVKEGQRKAPCFAVPVGFGDLKCWYTEKP